MKCQLCGDPSGVWALYITALGKWVLCGTSWAFRRQKQCICVTCFDTITKIKGE